MCGLIGSYCWQGEAIRLSLKPLLHRGPDSSGTWTSSDGSCWLGHTRLAIQDLTSSGHQPMTSQCGRVTLIFNGEIYNHLELRNKIRIHTWKGHSDTETLVEGIASFGPAFLKQLRGMFAIAAFYSDSGNLLLARDQFGIKPLYYQYTNSGLYFASERKALPGGTALPAQMISQTLAFGHDITPNIFCPSLDKDVRSLAPGICIELAGSNRALSSDLKTYSRDRPNTPIVSRAHACIELRDCLEEVVVHHLLSDTDVACFLSSGLDSGILAALASRLKPGSIDTFTIAWPDSSEDESQMARQMAAHCDTRHHEFILDDQEVLSMVENGLGLLDIPTADALNTFVISQVVSTHGFKVALSGLGADELFGGYPSHQFVRLLSLLRWIPNNLRPRILKILFPEVASKFMNLPDWDVWHLSLAVRRWFSDNDLIEAQAVPVSWPRQPRHLPDNPWSTISLAELYGYTEPMLLRDSDMMSMACGLELRVPFLDQRLVEFCMRLPQRFQSPGKSLLRQSCQDLFPLGYLERHKQGFLLPMRRWMLGPLHDLCLDRLDCLVNSQLLNSSWIQRQWQLFEVGQLSWTRVWTLVVLGEFAYRQVNSSFK